MKKFLFARAKLKNDIEEIIDWIKSQADPLALRGQVRFGITSKNNYGVSIKKLRPFAKIIGKDHSLALELWETGIHEARILATMIDEPDKITETQMEKWVSDFNSWDVCDQCCNNLFYKTPYAYKKVYEWCNREEEFIKRAGFVLMAVLSVHDLHAKDNDFKKLFQLIIDESVDERNFVKKAVNWALRQIGKRNLSLNKKALAVAETIKTIDSKSVRWIANDAIKELTNDKILERISRSKK